MYSNLQPSRTALRPQKLVLICAYLLGLLVLPVTIALCGELWLGSNPRVGWGQAPELEQSPEVEYTLT